MKRNNNFILRTVADKNVLVAFGEQAVDFNGIITLNEAGKFIWECLEQDTDIDAIATKLAEKYDIDKATALADTESFINSLREDNCIDE